MTTGTVDALYRWPVKSMAGEGVGALCLDRNGAAGDREHAVFDTFKNAPRRATARETSRLLAWAASYPGVADDRLARGAPGPQITAPGGATFAWSD
ncbi:MAG: MOSC N-terminal beta barrel domain-containing protein, partial [Solirubrobacterales bacterium]|nr:MOSC N-terminal beta barrel domain-containing protein [Solirubrobacterales bacterium]